ncbi:MAG: ABC transporter permease [Anaerolineae bacterium]|nr:ABC transporter permease [Anaerolineae bacterium]MDW8098362.1 ABC transporter permease [Anaerolineae bacterium]
MRKVWAFLRRDWLVESSYPVSLLLQFLGVFFNVFVFYFLSRLVTGLDIPALASYGGDYFAFILVGIAFSGYFGVGLSSFASNLRTAQTTGTLEAMLLTPTRLSTVIFSSCLWDYLLTTLRTLAHLALGALLFGVSFGQGNYLAAFLILILSVITFSSLGIIAASFIMVLKRGDPVTWLVNALASLLGGVFYPVDVLPGWLQGVSSLVPVTYALRAMRRALLVGVSTRALLPDMLILAAFGAFLLPISLLAFRFAVHRARVDGSLAHY